MVGQTHERNIILLFILLVEAVRRLDEKYPINPLGSSQVIEE
jgi:hypothetical protein